MWVQIKVTIFNALFALFLIGGLARQAQLLQVRVRRRRSTTPMKAGTSSPGAFALFFIFTAIANEYVRLTFIDDHFYRILG
jgi:intracellular septation protein